MKDLGSISDLDNSFFLQKEYYYNLSYSMLFNNVENTLEY